MPDDFTPLAAKDDFTALGPPPEKTWKEKLRDFSIPLPISEAPSIIGKFSNFNRVDQARQELVGPQKQIQLPVGTGQIKNVLTGVGGVIGAAAGPGGPFVGGFTGSQAGRLLQEISPELFGDPHNDSSWSPLTEGLKDAAINEVINLAFKGVKFTPERLKLIKQQVSRSLEGPALESTPGNFIPGVITKSPEQEALYTAGQSLKSKIAGGEMPNSIEEQGKAAFSKVHEHVGELEDAFNAQKEKLSKISPAKPGKEVEYDPTKKLPPDIKRGYKKALPVEQGGEGTPSQFFDTAIKTPEGTRRLVEYVGREDTANHYMTRFLDNHGTIGKDGEQFFDAIKARKTYEEQLPIIKEFTNADQRGQIKYFLDHAASIDPHLTKDMALNTTGDGVKIQIAASLAKLLFSQVSMIGSAVKIGLQVADSDLGKALLNPSFARAAAAAIKTPYQKAAAQDTMRILLGGLKGATVGILTDNQPVADVKIP